MRQVEIEGTLSCITSYLQDAASDFKSVWFRGQPDYDHKLLPSIFRQGPAYDVSYNEQRMFDEFKRRYPDQSASHTTTYEWLTLMQHYGLPTRLLDWTSNLLVGLYFCCVNDADRDGALYVLDPTYIEMDFSEILEMQLLEKSKSDFFRRLIYRMDHFWNDETKLNGITLRELKSDLFKRARFTGLSTGSKEEFESLEIMENLPNTVDHEGNAMPFIYQDIIRAFSNIAPFKPPHLNPRIRQQHGFFTFHGGMYIDGQEFISVKDMECHPYLSNSLIKVRVAAESKQKLLKELAYSGIKESTLFPEMEYQAKEIRKLFSTVIIE